MLFTMAFSEPVKLKVKRRARFKCCVCQQFDVQAHHIIPEKDGGPDTEDNAAPLCAHCHNVYGANPDKIKLIREVRDWWYGECDKLSTPPETGEELRERWKNAATKQDVADAVKKLTFVIQDIAANPALSKEQARIEISDVTCTATSSVTPLSFHRPQDRCRACGQPLPIFHMPWEKCPQCGDQPPDIRHLI